MAHGPSGEDLGVGTTPTDRRLCVCRLTCQTRGAYGSPGADQQADVGWTCAGARDRVYLQWRAAVAVLWFGRWTRSAAAEQGLYRAWTLPSTGLPTILPNGPLPIGDGPVFPHK